MVRGTRRSNLQTTNGSSSPSLREAAKNGAWDATKQSLSTIFAKIILEIASGDCFVAANPQGPPGSSQ